MHVVNEAAVKVALILMLLRLATPICCASLTSRKQLLFQDAVVVLDAAFAPPSHFLSQRLPYTVLFPCNYFNRTWRPSPAPQPVGRGEAVVLDAALDEALPAGGIAAKYQPWSEASQSPAQVWL